MINRVINARVVRAVIVSLSLFATSLVSMIPQVAIAQTGAYVTPSSAIIKYLGFVEDKLLFNVDIENKKEERCWISIQDESGEVLYRQDFKEARFTKTFGINKDEIEGKNLSFVLIKGKEKQEQVFQVSTNTRVIQDVIVAKQ
jgi:hypothetical protein